jgi:apolipoprotein N-acyltransferase
LCLGKYHEIITENYIPIYYSRNFIFTGLPFFSIGLFIKKNEVFIQKHTSKCAAMLAFIIFCIAGILCNISFGMHNKIGDMYITTVFASISLFIFCLKSKEKENALSRIGREDNLYIYIFHPFIGGEIQSIIQKAGLLPYYQYFSTAIVLITTIILIRVLKRLRIIGNLI